MKRNGAPQDNVSKSPVETLAEQTVNDCCASMSRLLGACSIKGFPLPQKMFIWEYLKSAAVALEASTPNQNQVTEQVTQVLRPGDQEAPLFPS